MGITRSLVLLFLAAGCTSSDEETTEGGSSPELVFSDTTDTGSTSFQTDSTTGSGGEPDPDVNTWVPESWPVETPARIVFFGDSITKGAGARSDGLDYVSLLLSNDNERYPAYEGWDLTTMFGGVPAYDASQNGATTETVIDVQLPAIMDAIGEQPEGLTLVVGTIGGNDAQDVVFGLRDLGEERERIADNVDQIANYFLDDQRFPDGAMVYITNVYEPTDAEGQADGCFFGIDLSFVLDDFEGLNQDTLARAQQSGWAWVDLRGHFLGHGHNFDNTEMEAYDESDPTLWMAGDCIHPNDRGHHEVRRLFLSAIDNRPLPL